MGVLPAGAADVEGLDLAYAFDLSKCGFEFIYDGCLVFGEFDLDE